MLSVEEPSSLASTHCMVSQHACVTASRECHDSAAPLNPTSRRSVYTLLTAAVQFAVDRSKRPQDRLACHSARKQMLALTSARGRPLLARCSARGPRLHPPLGMAICPCVKRSQPTSLPSRPLPSPSFRTFSSPDDSMTIERHLQHFCLHRALSLYAICYTSDVLPRVDLAQFSSNHFQGIQHKRYGVDSAFWLSKHCHCVSACIVHSNA